MSVHQSPDGVSQGSPNLEFLERLMEEWTPTDIASSLEVSKVTVPAASGGSTAGIEAVIPVGAKIVDAVVRCTGSNSGGTMQVKTGADSPVAISDAMICAVDTTIVRAGSLNDAYTIVSDDGIRIWSNAEADQGIVYLIYLK